MLHKRAMYPLGHPHLQESTDRFVDRLESLLSPRDVAGHRHRARTNSSSPATATNPRNALLSDLARRFHRHRIATLRFDAGSRSQEIDDLLAGVAADPQGEAGPFGLRPGAGAAWVAPHGSSRPSSPACSCRTTTTTTERPETPGGALWLGLAHLALSADGSPTDDAEDPLLVARAIDAQPEQVGVRPGGARLPRPDRRRDVRSPGRMGAADSRAGLAAGHVAQARNASPRARGRRRRRRAAPVRAHRLQVLAVEAVIEVVEAAAATSGQTISHQLLRLLHKFAQHAEQGPGSACGRRRNPRFGGTWRSCITGWDAGGPESGRLHRRPRGHGAAVAPRQRRGGGAARLRARHACCRSRSEAGLRRTAGRRCARHADRDATASRAALDLLRAAPAEASATARSAVASRWRRRRRLRAAIGAAQLDFATIERLVARLGPMATEPLLDVLERAGDRSVRAPHAPPAGRDRPVGGAGRRGPAQGRALVRAAKPAGPAPHAARLAAGLLGRVVRATSRASGCAARPTSCCSSFPPHRASAILHGLDDASPEIVTLVLRAAVDDCPPEALRAVERFTEDRRRPAELRGARGARARARDGGPQAVARLLELAGARRSLFGWRLDAKSPVVLAAVSALARLLGARTPRWPACSRPRASHDDAEIRLAARMRFRMSEPVRFLTALSQALSTLGLYGDGHPAVAPRRGRGLPPAGRPAGGTRRRSMFTFLPDEVLFGRDLLPELERWEWSARFAQGGIERLEINGAVSRGPVRPFPRPRAAAVLGLRGRRARRPVAGRPRGHPVRARPARRGGDRAPVRTEPLPVATLGYSLREERDAVGWMHQEVSAGSRIPLLEAYGVVRSLSLAMHGGQAMVMPLLQLKEFDQYTTTHSMNVSVLAMALGEFLGLAPAAVRGFGLAGLLHDLGKVRIPREILSKPGKLTPEERAVVEAHPGRRRADDPRGRRAAGSRRRRGLRAPPLPRRRRLPARCTTARGAPGQPPGARVRRVRRAPHPPPLSRRLVVRARRSTYIRERGRHRSSIRPWPRRSSR